MAVIEERLHHAVALHQSGVRDQAAAAYRDVLALAPDEPNALHLLGLLLCEDGAPDQGLSLIGRARALHPDVAPIAFNHGNVLMKLDRADEAVAEYQAALRLAPEDVAAWHNLARALLEIDRTEEALDAAEAGLALEPLMPGLHVAHGLALQRLDQPEAALLSLAAAQALAPADPEVHAQRACVLYAQGDWPATLNSFAAALALNPDHVFTLYNLARVHHEMGDPQTALQIYDRAAVADPGHAPTLWNRQMCRLLAGDYSRWPQRWSIDPNAPSRPFVMPKWDGTSLAGRRILLHVAQGLGDTLQFCRFVEQIAAEADQVVLEVQPPLVRLMRRSFDVQIIAQAEPHRPVDWHCDLVELPGLIGLTWDSIPARIPYLKADPSPWRARLNALPGRKIGLVWAGAARLGQRANTRVDRRRSMTAARLAPLSHVPGLHLISLQKGPPADQAGDIPGLIDWTDELDDFADTADLVAGLDLVISVDTSTAHVAAALGVPVWLLNRFDTCWRWGLGRDDSPWYPGLRQFRQAAPGDWGGVIARVIAALG